MEWKLQLVVTSTILLLFSLTCNGTAFAPGYELSNVQHTTWGIQGSLSRISGSSGPYGGDIDNLELYVYYQTEDILRVKIVDPANDRWEVPDVIQFTSPPTNPPASTNYRVDLINSPFGIAVSRITDGVTLFNTSSPATGTQFNGLIFEDQYIEWNSQMLESPNIYGLGERVYSFKLDTQDNDYPMFNRDQGTPYGPNLYGTHPMYMEIRQANSVGKAHGVFFLNTNAMNVHLEPKLLTWQTIGGVIDVSFFMGPSPIEVIQQYTSAIGKPHFPPYWQLGFHQCRWGYESVEKTSSVALNYRRFNIPLDTMWNDIDYMDGYRIFTTDPVHFPLDQVKEFVDYLHEQNQHYIVIVDPGVKVDPNYQTYIDGLELDIFIKQSNYVDDVIGKVWPGYTSFPDFTNVTARDYWKTQIQQFYDSGVEVDGLWIDMNEISNFCTGNCVPENGSLSQYSMQNDPYDNPPFSPVFAPLNTSTISMNTITSLGVNYNTHDLFAFYESMATDDALQQIRNQRSVVISRSSFAGSGKYTSHWLGDNTSDWDDLYYSIAGVLNFQMFGIPMVGADICGFNGNSTVELCSRWMQLGSFYPFSRNHNSISSTPQEPWAFESESHIEITRKALNLRYLLLPYFYTLFFEAATNGSPVWHALIWNFPNDPNCLDIDRQFMVGTGLLVSPALNESVTTVSAYFPAGVWYDFYTGDQQGSVSAGSTVDLSAPIDVIPVSIRGGFILPTQLPALTTAEARKNPFVLIVALDQSNAASGNVYIDDGVSLDSLSSNNYTTIQFDCSANSVHSTVTYEGYNISHLFLAEIKVFGVSAPVTGVVVNGVQTYANYFYSTQHKTLLITGLLLRMDVPWTVSWQ